MILRGWGYVHRVVDVISCDTFLFLSSPASGQAGATHLRKERLMMTKVLLFCVLVISAVTMFGVTPPYPSNYCRCKITDCPDATSIDHVPCVWKSMPGGCRCDDVSKYVRFTAENPKARSCERTEAGKDAGVGCNDCSPTSCPDSCGSGAVHPNGCVTECRTAPVDPPLSDPCPGPATREACEAPTHNCI